MKKYLSGLFYFTFLGLGALTTSCEKPNEITEEQSYRTYENHVQLTGEDNMRDLGGIIGENGKRVLYHKLYRSGDLSALTAADKDIMEARGIKQIIDLRTAADRYNRNDQTINNAIIYELPALTYYIGGSSSMSILMQRIAEGKVNATDYMTKYYTWTDNYEIENLETIFDLLETGNTTLWHCTTGKDRTGIVTALVLSSLGVDKEAIIKDYMVSNLYLSTTNETTMEDYDSKYGQGAGNKLSPMLEAEKVYINAFFNTIDTKYGSMDRFLDLIKVDKAKMKELYLEK
jgi:protein-tyrosine phosphatase